MVQLPFFSPFGKTPYGELTENSPPAIPAPFYHLRSYLDSCASRFYGTSSSYRLYKFKDTKVQKQEQSLAKILEFGSVQKFRDQQYQWLDARIPIPRLWLDALDVNLSMLELYADFDAHRTKQALLSKYILEHYVVPIPPFMNLCKTFPEPVVEDQALKSMQVDVDEHLYTRAYCKIGHIRVYEFKPDQPWAVFQAEPKLLLTEKEVEPTGYLGFRNWAPIGIGD